MAGGDNASDGRSSRQVKGRRWRRLGLALLAGGLLIYGLLVFVVARAFGPGSSDEIVTGGLEAMVWFALSTAGLLTALAALWLAIDGRMRPAMWAAILAIGTLAGWTALLVAWGG